MTLERNKKIYARHAAGETYKSIAADYGISQERVRQIYYGQIRRMEKEKLQQKLRDNGWIKEESP